MGDSEILKIEKVNIVKRLEAVEDHMKRGEETRVHLMTSFSELKTSVNRLEIIAQQVGDVLKIANAIKWVLTKIFLAICTAVGIAIAPYIFSFLGKILSKHNGG